MIYVDTSVLLKTLIAAVGSEAVDEAISKEPSITVSSLVELEIQVQLKAKYLAGAIRKNRYRNLCEDFKDLKEMESFLFVDLPASVFRIAVRQHSNAKVHCRSLDRLHLAAMEELGIRRLMTHDFRQADAARDLGIEIVMPGVN
jgi:predicted nucleic acid-binding protein